MYFSMVSRDSRSDICLSACRAVACDMRRTASSNADRSVRVAAAKSGVLRVSPSLILFMSLIVCAARHVEAVRSRN